MKLAGNKWVLPGILLLGLFVRIYAIDGQSLWFDEGYSIRMAHLTPPSIISKAASEDFHPPLYYLGLHYWIALFGDSEFSARFPSAVLGIISILMMYKVGKLLFDKNVGILSSLVLALSVFHVEYSQEARSYSLMAFLTLLSFYCFLKLFRERSLRASIGYSVSSVILMYTHVYGLFIVVSQNIFFFLKNFWSPAKALSVRKWVLMQGILVIFFLPWLNTLLGQAARVQRGYWVPVPTALSVIYTFGGYTGSRLLLFFFLIFSGLAIIGREKVFPYLKEAFKSEENLSQEKGLSPREVLYLLFIWLSTPIVLPFLISHCSQPVFISRGTIGGSFAFYLLVAKGISDIPKRFLKAAALGLVVMLSLSNIWGYYHKVYKDPWREVAQSLDLSARPGDLVLFNSAVCQYLFDYYSKRTDLIKTPFPANSGEANKENIEQLESKLKKHHRVWIILSHGEKHGLPKKMFRKSYNLSYYREYSIERVVRNQIAIRVFLFEG